MKVSQTFIAFAECVLYPRGHWKQIAISRRLFPTITGDAYSPIGINAELRLLDINGTRRYFNFHNNTVEVRIVNML